MSGERDKLLHIEEKLSERVVGQPEAVRAVSDAIRLSRAGAPATSLLYEQRWNLA